MNGLFGELGGFGERRDGVDPGEIGFLAPRFHEASSERLPVGEIGKLNPQIVQERGRLIGLGLASGGLTAFPGPSPAIVGQKLVLGRGQIGRCFPLHGRTRGGELCAKSISADNDLRRDDKKGLGAVGTNRVVSDVRVGRFNNIARAHIIEHEKKRPLAIDDEMLQLRFPLDKPHATAIEGVELLLTANDAEPVYNQAMVAWIEIELPLGLMLHRDGGLESHGGGVEAGKRLYVYLPFPEEIRDVSAFLRGQIFVVGREIDPISGWSEGDMIPRSFGRTVDSDFRP